MTASPSISPLDPVLDQDPALRDLLHQERDRQQTYLSLIASENHTSQAVRAACSSVLTDKYAEGYPGARYYGGCEIADQVEDLAKERLVQLFGGGDGVDLHANVQPHSGTTANMAVLTALAGRGGRILGMSLAEGGHLSHGHRASATGKLFEAFHYGVDPLTGRVDLDRVRDIARTVNPSVLIVGASSYPRELDYAAFGEIAKEVKAVLLADIAHPAGLVAAGVIGSPVGHADVITFTTHKTLRGPRGGAILMTEEHKKKLDSAVFPGGQGGPLMHQIAGKAVAFGEALGSGFKDYQNKVVTNARALASKLAENGLPVVTGGTDTHIVVVDLRDTDKSGAEVEDLCRGAHLTVNKNMVPADPRSARETSGIRLGTAAATTRGCGVDEMHEIAEVITGIVRGENPESFRGRVGALCEKHPVG